SLHCSNSYHPAHIVRHFNHQTVQYPFRYRPNTRLALTNVWQPISRVAFNEILLHCPSEESSEVAGFLRQARSSTWCPIFHREARLPPVHPRLTVDAQDVARARPQITFTLIQCCVRIS